ncbi:MAG: hypothetical protein U1D65_12815 [Pseudomonas sp.]|nr:hypothetical protein [Pseudomonas sp.]MDZ4192882.1 hypothetical protein [Pseudomonas sp.]
MARYEASGELMPRHMKALNALLREATWALGKDNPAVSGVREAMAEVREIAAQQKSSRRHRYGYRSY